MLGCFPALLGPRVDETLSEIKHTIKIYGLVKEEHSEHNKHRFQPLPHQGQVVPRSMAVGAAGALFKRASCKVPDSYRKVVSAKSQASWYSPAHHNSLDSV